MGTDLRIYKQDINYDAVADKFTNTYTQVGETIHDVNTIDSILGLKEWGIEGEGGAIAEVHGQHIIHVLLSDSEYTTDNIEEDEVYRVELSY